MQNTDDWQILEPEIMDTDKYLSSSNAPDLEEDVRLCVESGARRMVINCASLTYLTGAGIRTFLSLARMLADAGGTLSVQNLQGQPLEMFKACGLDSMIRLLDRPIQAPSLGDAAIRAA